MRLSRRRLLGGLALGSAAVATGALAPRPAAAAAVPVAPGLAVQPRAAWAGDGRPPVGPLDPEEVRFLLVHHTASANGADPVSVMQGAYDFHTGPEKEWPDVAYNFFIDQFGVVWEGRAGSLAGPVEASATGGSQGFAQLVCLLGDFTAVLPTPAALDSLNRTLAWLADRYAVPTEPGATVTFTSRGSNLWPAGETVTADTISGHRDMSATACPGDTFYPYLVSRIPAEVTALRQAAAPPETTSPPAPETPPSTAGEPVATPPPTRRVTTSAPPTTDPPTTTVATTTSTTSSTTTSTTTSSVPAATAPSGELEVAAAPLPTPRGSATPTGASSGGDDAGDLALPLLGVTGVLATAGAVWFASRRTERDDVTEPTA